MLEVVFIDLELVVCVIEKNKMRYDKLGHLIKKIEASRDNINAGESYPGVYIIWDYDMILLELHSVVDAINDMDQKERIRKMIGEDN